MPIRSIGRALSSVARGIGSAVSGVADVAAPFFTGISAGDILQGGASLFGGMQRNEANAQEAALNRRFEMDMSNTAVQRRKTDLFNAGINPLLAGDMVASTPSGSMATYADAITPAIASARDNMRSRAEIELKKSSSDLQKQQQDTAEADERNKRTENANIRKMNQLLEKQIDQKNAETFLTLNKNQTENELQTKLRADTAAALGSARELNAKASLTELESEIYSSAYGTGLKYLEKLLPFGASAKGAYDTFTQRKTRFNPRKEGVYNKKTGEVLQ